MADKLVDPFDEVPGQRVAEPSVASKTIVDPFDEGGPSRFEAAVARAPLNQTQPRGMGREPDVKPGSGGLGLAFKQGMVIDEPTQLRLAAEHLFPNDPKAIERFGFVNGRVAFENDEGQLQYATGRASEFFGNLAANVPEIAGGIVGSFAASPIVGTTAGVTAARGFKRAAAGALLDEPQTVEGNLKDIGKTAAIELATAGAAKGALALANRGRSINLTPRDLAEAQATQSRIKQNTGIDTDLALASGDRRLLGVRNYLAQQPNAGADMLQAADERSAEQFGKAAEAVLDKVAAGVPADTLGRKGVNAAQAAIKTARQKVYSEVGPLYEAAYKAVPEVTTATKQGEKILDYLKLPYFGDAFRAGQTLRALETGSAIRPRERVIESLSKSDPEAGTYERATTVVDSTATGAKRITSKLTSGERRQTPEGTYTKRSDTTHADISSPSLAELDYTKRALDEKIESLMEGGQRQRARALKIKRDEFVAALDALPNQEWQRARTRYGELAKTNIEPLEQGVVGVVANIADNKTATVAAKIFRDANVTPGEIARARSALAKEDPEGWNALVRQFLSNELNAARKVTQAGNEANVAGKLHQRIWGDPEGRKRMGAALGTDASKALEGLMEAAETLGKAPIKGSNTQPNQAIAKTLEGPAGWWARVLLKPKESFVDAAQQKAIEQNSVKLVEALLDPAKVRQLKIATKISDPVRRLTFITSVLGVQVVPPAAQLAAGPPES